MSTIFKFFQPYPVEDKPIFRNLYFWIIVTVLFILIIPYYTYEYARAFTDSFLPWFAQLVIFEFSNRINGMLIFVILLFGIFFLSWRHTFIIWILSILIILPHVVAYSFSQFSLLTNLFYFTLPILILVLIIWELRLREDQRRSLEIREEERQSYLAQIMEVQEDERRRISQALHDETCQTLNVVGVAVKKASANEENPDKAHDNHMNMKWILEQVYRVEEDVRRLSLDLHPSVLDNLGLVSGINWLASEMKKAHHLKIEIINNGVFPSLPAKIELIVFRFVQEALNNIRNHSYARNVSINLSYHENVVKITVKDDGKGFDLNSSIGQLATQGKLGLIGMQEKAKSIDGLFELHTSRNKGTTVSLQFKL